VIADNVIYGDAYREGDASIDCSTVNLLGEQLLSLYSDYSGSKLAEIQNFCSRNTLSDQSFKSNVHDLGSLLILGAHITGNDGCQSMSPERYPSLLSRATYLMERSVFSSSSSSSSSPSKISFSSSAIVDCFRVCLPACFPRSGHTDRRF